MKIGVTQIILGSWSLDDTLDMCQEAGYEALELVFGAGRDPHVDMSDDEIRAVKKKCDDAGVEVTSAIAWYEDRGNMLSLDSAANEAGLKCLTRAIDIANVMDVGAILLHPGQLTVEGTYEAAWDRFLGMMKEIAPYAQKQKVAVGIENVWNKFLLTPRENAEFVDAVGNDFVGVYLDTANMMFYGFPEHWIRGLGKRIKRVHFKDFVRKDRQFVPLMDGDTDWATIVSLLREMGYDNSVIHEVGGDRGVQIEMAKRMKKIVGM